MVAARAESPAKASRREVVLDAALALFAQKGYEATPVPEIARAADLSIGGLYRYYKGKDQLVNAVYQRSKKRLGAWLAEGLTEERGIRKKFRHLWNRMDSFSRSHPMDFQFLELHNHSAYLDRRSRQVEKEVQQPCLDFIREAQKAGEMRPMEMSLVMSIFMGVYLGYFRAVQAGEIENPAKAQRESEEAAWRAVARNPV